MDRLVCFLIIFLIALPVSGAGERLDFHAQIVPIIERHCIRCHSHGIKKGDLSLATADDLRANAYVIANDVDNSYLIEVVTSQNGQPPAMPHEGNPLAEEEVELLKQWIGEGAMWPDDLVIREKSKADTSWWAYQPLQARKKTIDEYIQDTLTANKLTLNPPADRRTLIRRATYDLLGLPPTPEDVEAFINNPDPQAYEQLIERLLASPHYGERWGRHWLDVVRFGESIG